MKFKSFIIGLILALLAAWCYASNDGYLEHRRKAFRTKAFKFTILTLNEDDTFTLPIYNGGTYDFNVDWGDGSSDDITAWDDAAVTHTYADSGPTTYVITITGAITGWCFNDGGDKLLMKNIASFGPLRLGNLGYNFWGCSNLTISATDTLDLTGTTTLIHMFAACISLTTAPSMALWDTSLVTNMSNMFNGCFLFNQSVANFDTSLVTEINRMFAYCHTFNQSVYNFDTSSVTDMEYVFYDCIVFDQDVSGFDITALTAPGATGMLLNTSFSTANYDALLIAWEAQAEPADIVFSVGTTKYTGGGAAATARAALVTNGWVITDGGTV